MSKDLRPEYARRRLRATPMCAVVSGQAAALAGDPIIQGAVTRCAPDNAAALISAILVQMDPGDRSRVVQRAISSVAGHKKLPGVPWFAAFSTRFTPDQSLKLLNGLGMILLSAGAATEGEQVGQMLSRAASLSTGAPYAGDPANFSCADPVLAKAIMELVTSSGALTELVRTRPELLSYLEDVASGQNAKMATVAPSDSTLEQVRLKIYDCVMNQQPLGGDPLVGGPLLDALKEGVQRFVSGGVAASASATAQSLMTNAQTPVAFYNAALLNGISARQGVDSASALREAQIEAYNATVEKYGADEVGTAGISDPSDLASPSSDASVADNSGSGTLSVATSLETTREAATKALADAVAAINGAKETSEKMQQTAAVRARDVSRLQWASALLQAPDSVADLLVQVDPNMRDVTGALQSCLAMLPAAKSTGSISSLKALSAALRSAMTSGSETANTLSALVSGDPSSVEGAQPVGGRRSARLKDAVMAEMRAAAEMGMDDVADINRKEVDDGTEDS